MMHKKSQTGLKAEMAKVYVGEGTTVIPLPFDDRAITAPGHNPRKVSDLQSGAEKIHTKGVFK